MSSQTLTMTATATPVFPDAEVKHRLREELQKIADEGSVLRSEWEPLLDSKQVVGIVLALEELFSFELPPDKVVRMGGYNSVEEAIDDMFGRIEKIWAEHSNPRCANEQRSGKTVRRQG